MEEVQKSRVQKYAWDYFQMHSGQRLTTFNYYLTLSTLIVTGLFVSFQKDFTYPSIGVALGPLLSLISFIFWKIDVRNKQLIKNAEAALALIEDSEGFSDIDGEPHPLRLIRCDDFLTRKLRSQKSLWPWRQHYSYSRSFNLVFWVFGLVGIAGGVLCIIRMLNR
jgi:hypothetical protein